jgi:AhpD family alkylhydroperoxidase
MMPRLNPFTVAPDGVAALVAVENYLKTCGLDHRLLALVKTRVSQINGCAYCISEHTRDGQKHGVSFDKLMQVQTTL